MDVKITFQSPEARALYADAERKEAFKRAFEELKKPLLEEEEAPQAKWLSYYVNCAICHKCGDVLHFFYYDAGEDPEKRSSIPTRVVDLALRQFKADHMPCGERATTWSLSDVTCWQEFMFDLGLTGLSSAALVWAFLPLEAYDSGPYPRLAVPNQVVDAPSDMIALWKCYNVWKVHGKTWDLSKPFPSMTDPQHVFYRKDWSNWNIWIENWPKVCEAIDKMLSVQEIDAPFLLNAPSKPEDYETYIEAFKVILDIFERNTKQKKYVHMKLVL